MTCYLYVLPLTYEDILKLGISRDPLARVQAFARRYYEFFDLTRSLLVEYDCRQEAQARETELHRRLCDWNAMQPITVPGAAAGKTEWYRGAYGVVRAALQEDVAGGRVVHLPALPWWQSRLCIERDALYEWIVMLLRDGAYRLPPDERRALIADALDAYTALGVPLGNAMPPELAPDAP